jgi:hypothetical protein
MTDIENRLTAAVNTLEDSAGRAESLLSELRADMTDFRAYVSATWQSGQNYPSRKVMFVDAGVVYVPLADNYVAGASIAVDDAAGKLFVLSGLTVAMLATEQEAIDGVAGLLPDAAGVRAAIQDAKIGQNLLVNGGFDNWDYGTSGPAQNFGPSRWYIGAAGVATTWQQQGSGDLAIIGAEGNTLTQIVYKIEGADSYRLVDKPVTISGKIFSDIAGRTIFIVLAYANTLDTFLANTTSIASFSFVAVAGVNTFEYTVANMPAGTENGVEITIGSPNLVGGFITFDYVKLEDGLVATAQQAESISVTDTQCLRYRRNIRFTATSVSNGRVHASNQLSVPMHKDPEIIFKDLAGNVNRYSGLAGDNQIFAAGGFAVVNKKTLVLDAITNGPNANGPVYVSVELNAELL